MSNDSPPKERHDRMAAGLSRTIGRQRAIRNYSIRRQTMWFWRVTAGHGPVRTNIEPDGAAGLRRRVRPRPARLKS
jgi:hypothetical protein